MKIFLAVALITTPFLSHAQDAEATDAWPGRTWETAVCPIEKDTRLFFQKNGHWNSEESVWVENKSIRLEYTQSKSPDVHFRWFANPGDVVELLCGKKYIFFATDADIILEIAYPVRPPKE